MDKEQSKRLIDEKPYNLEPEPRETLLKMAIEENMRIKSIERDGKEWRNCTNCVYFEALKNDKKGIKVLLKHKIWGYCLNTTIVKKPKKKPTRHLIYINTPDYSLQIKGAIGLPCYKPISKNKNNFLNLMMKQEADNLTELLQNPSLSEEERKYFRDMRESYQE
jgi:hypothetical protein